YRVASGDVQCIGVFSIFSQVCKIQILLQTLYTVACLQSKSGSTRLSLFSGNQDYTVRCLGTVNRRGGSVLKNFDTFNVGGINKRKRITGILTGPGWYNHSVDHVNRFIGGVYGT